MVAEPGLWDLIIATCIMCIALYVHDMFVITNHREEHYDDNQTHSLIMYIVLV